MSTTDYVFNSYTTYTVGYSWSSKGEQKVGKLVCSARSEEEALQEALKGLLVTNQPDFKVWVIDKTIHEKKK